MTIRGAIATILGCGLLLATIGAGVGYVLAEVVPSYYRGVFRAGREPGFDPISVGVGQGLTQGLAGGIAVGIALVAIVCWRETCLQRVASAPSIPSRPSVGARLLARRMLLFVGVPLALGFCTCTGLLLGLLGGERGAYHRRYLEEREALAPVLAGDPAFAGVRIHEYSAGGVVLLGEVPNAVDLSRLRSRVEQAIGASRADDAMLAIEVRR